MPVRVAVDQTYEISCVQCEKSISTHESTADSSSNDAWGPDALSHAAHDKSMPLVLVDLH